jgi:hypothetical protein
MAKAKSKQEAERQADIDERAKIVVQAETKAGPALGIAYPTSSGNRTVVITAEFEMVVPKRVSLEGIKEHFISKLSGNLLAILKQVSVNEKI